MAQLSGTRVEASTEAKTDTKQELKLRTVVQFVRVLVQIPSSCLLRQPFDIGEHHVTRLDNHPLSDHRQPTALKRSQQVHEW